MKVMAALFAAGLLTAAGAAVGEIVVEESQPGRSVSEKTDAPGAGSGIEASGDVIEFLNRDRLHGRFVSASSRGIVWTPFASPASVEFGLAAVARVSMGGAKKDASAGNAVVILTNGDSLPGNLASIDDNTLALETPYAGRLAIRRAMVETIRPKALSSAILYAGPKSLEEWSLTRTGHAKTWMFKNGALYAIQPYAISRAIENFPDRARIEFTAEWRAGYPSFWVAFCGDNLQEPANCYMLQVSGASIYLQRMSRESGSRNVGGGENLERFSNRRTDKGRFGIYINKERRSVALMVDGKLAREWVDPAGFAGKGNVLMFRPNNQGDLKISQILVAGWDGALPSAGETQAASGEDGIRFENGDRVSGKLLGISGGKVRFEASYGAFEAPVERVGEISLARARAERARRNREDVRCSFCGGGQVTLKLVSAEQGTAKGSSENFGDASVDLGYVLGMDFNIYREAGEGEDEDDSGWPTDY